MSSKSIVAWTRLVRYISVEDESLVQYGEPIIPSTSSDIAELALSGKLEVKVCIGNHPLDVRPSSKIQKFKKLLGPLEPKDVPHIRCIGLNYKSHILGTGRPLPTCPSIFTKPPPSVADHEENIPIPKVAQEQCDYEGELVIVIGRDAKNVSEDDALGYVAAYTAGKDVSARDWQREASKAGPVPQWTFSKSFDKQSLSLIRHSHNHEDGRRHSCAVCGFVFYRRDLLSRHARIHEMDSLEGDQSVAQDAEEADQLSSRKRRRCHTACNACREARSKCDGRTPCLICSQLVKDCIYSGNSLRMSEAPQSGKSVIIDQPATNATSASRRNVTRDETTPSNRDSELDIESAGTENGNATASAHVLMTPPSDAAGVNLATLPVCPMPTNLIDSIDINNNMASSAADRLWITDPLNTTSWPWFHENLYLQNDISFAWPTDYHLLLISGAEIDSISETRQDLSRNVQYLAEPPSTHSSNPVLANERVSAPYASLNDIILQEKSLENSRLARLQGDDLNYMKLNRPQDSNNFKSYSADQAEFVEELIRNAVSPDRGLSSAQPDNDYWRLMSLKACAVFRWTELQTADDSNPVLHHFVDLYLEHFGNLWPLLPSQGFDRNSLHPILYLTLTSIGAMYDGPRSQQYGALVHDSLRKYFGQKKAFSFSQRLGAILVAQARRMDLFKPRRRRETSSRRGETADRSISDIVAETITLEGRRRLAFGILRAETYASVLLNTRPFVSAEEIDLELPCSDDVWRGGDRSASEFLLAFQQDTTPGRDLPFSDIMRISMDRDEPSIRLGPPGQELLIFALQEWVWRFSHDPDLFQRLTDSEPENLTADMCGFVENSKEWEFRNPNHRTASSTPTAGSKTFDVADHLGCSPRHMRDLRLEFSRLNHALKKWKQSFTTIRTSTNLQRSRNHLISSLIIYHLSYLRLYAPVEDLHQISYRLLRQHPVDHETIDRAKRWARRRGASIAVQHALTICSLVDRETHRGGGGGPSEARAQFNFMTFCGLHHAAVVLWTFAGMQTGCSAEEHECPFIYRTSKDGARELPICKRQSSELLVHVAGLYKLITPGSWSTFALAALQLSHYQFPLEP